MGQAKNDNENKKLKLEIKTRKRNLKLSMYAGCESNVNYGATTNGSNNGNGERNVSLSRLIDGESPMATWPCLETCAAVTNKGNARDLKNRANLPKSRKHGS